jgi:hypothetical protein
VSDLEALTKRVSTLEEQAAANASKASADAKEAAEKPPVAVVDSALAERVESVAKAVGEVRSEMV